MVLPVQQIDKDRDQRFYQRLNEGLVIGHVGLMIFCLFFLPLLTDRAGWWLLLSALIANSQWALLHEAIHHHLLPHRAANRLIGRILAILLGSSFRLLQFGHLTHHRFNRHPLDCPDLYDPAVGQKWKIFLRYYFELFLGIYLAEMAVPIFFLLPRRIIARLINKVYRGEDSKLSAIQSLAQQQLTKPTIIREIRQDVVIHGLLLFALIFVWNGQLLFLFGFYLLRGVLLSYIDNIYHFGTSPANPEYAYNLKLPEILRYGILNMNLHRVHHRHMHLPWWQLTAEFTAENEQFDHSFGQMMMRQIKGPVVNVTAKLAPNL